MTATHARQDPINRGHLEAKLRELRGDVDAVGESAKQYALVAGAVVAVAVVALAFTLGKRKGKKKRTVVEVPASALSPYAGTYEITPGVLLEISVRDGGLYARSNLGGGAARLWPESRTSFFSDEAEAQIDFVRDAGGTVTGLVLHQFGRDRPVRKIR